MFLTFQFTKAFSSKSETRSTGDTIPKSKWLNPSYTSGRWLDDLALISLDIDKYRILFGQKLIPNSRGDSYEYNGPPLIDALKKCFLQEMEFNDTMFSRDYSALADLYTLYTRIIFICNSHSLECISPKFSGYLAPVPCDVPTFADCHCARGYLLAMGIKGFNYNDKNPLDAAIMEFRSVLLHYPDYSPAKDAIQILYDKQSQKHSR